VVLDFDAQGRLLGIEFIGHHLLPPSLSTPAPPGERGHRGQRS
jgi:hypothetical protein